MSLPVRCLALDQLSAAEIAAWRRLAAVSLEPNPFQEPEFVLPLVRSHRGLGDAQLLIVPSARNDDWLAACVVRVIPATLTRPLQRLRSFQSIHTYLDTPLIDRNRPEAAANRLLSVLSDCQLGHGLRVHTVPLDGVLRTTLENAAQQTETRAMVEHVWRRATYRRADMTDDPLAHCSKSRRKSLRRAWRSLEQHGPVSFEMLRPDTGCDRELEQFLELEHSGWKRDGGTSLLATEEDTNFFTDMVRGFADEGRVIFGELSVAERVVASTCNLLAGDTLYAFKVGWDQNYSEGSPGLWSELLLPRAVFRGAPQVQRIDSCAKAGSHLDSLWPTELRMGAVIYAWSRPAAWLAEMRQSLRVMRGRSLVWIES